MYSENVIRDNDSEGGSSFADLYTKKANCLPINARNTKYSANPLIPETCWSSADSVSSSPGQLTNPTPLKVCPTLHHLYKHVWVLLCIIIQVPTYNDTYICSILCLYYIICISFNNHCRRWRRLSHRWPWPHSPQPPGTLPHHYEGGWTAFTALTLRAYYLLLMVVIYFSHKYLYYCKAWNNIRG